jgi:hypothetical protein
LQRLENANVMFMTVPKDPTGSTLPPKTHMVQLILRRVNEPSLSVEVMPTTSFGDIKDMVEVQEAVFPARFWLEMVGRSDVCMPVGFQRLHGIPKAAVRFIYAGKPIKDTETVASAGAAHETGA